jgi:hypothetical protein
MAGLGAFFASVVILGNALLAAVYKPLPGKAESRGPSEYLDRRVRRVKNAFERVRETILGDRKDQSALPEPEWAFGYLPEPVLDDDDPPSSNNGSPDPARYLNLTLKSDFPPYWYAPAPSTEPTFERLARESMWPGLGREALIENWTLWESFCDRSLVHLGLDLFFSLPRTFFDEVVDVVRWWFPADQTISLCEEDDSSMVSRFVQIRDPGRVDSPFREFAREWVNRQDRIFGSAGDAYLFSVDFDNIEDVPVEDVMYEEGKILLDVFRRVYLSKYFGGTEERLKGEAWRVSQWKPIDYVLCPPVLAAYTWYRGWDRRLRLLGTKLRIKIEPPAKIYETTKHEGRRMVGAVTLEWQVGDFPIKLVAAAGWNEGHAELDFIGIGTSVGIAKKAVHMRVVEEEREEERKLDD